MSWQPIDCDERDKLFSAHHKQWSVLSSLTDPDGQFGNPVVRTEWGTSDGTPALKDLRHPCYPQSETRRDRLPCEHYRWQVQP